MSKTQTILENLRQMIQNREFENGKIPGERELAAAFNCGRGTVRAALSHLEADGWIDRCRRRGTTIRDILRQKNSGSIALVMRTGGHFYEDVYREILNRFIHAGYTIRSVSTDPLFYNLYRVSPKTAASLKKSLEKLMNADQALFILHTYRCREIPCFEKMCRYNTILFGNPVRANIHSAHGVWLDYEMAGYIGGRYLLEQGCRRPVYFPQFFSLLTHLNPDFYTIHKEKMLIDGFRKAMLEGGIDPETSVINSFSPSPKAHRQILTSLSLLDKNIPDGIFAADTNIAFFIRQLMENQGHIPENMSFVGLYNTPWSRGQSLIPFPSIDFNAAGIADSLLKLAGTAPEDREDILVRPRLVVRATCCSDDKPTT